MPEVTIALAVCSIGDALTLQPKEYQSFQPIGGVAASAFGVTVVAAVAAVDPAAEAVGEEAAAVRASAGRAEAAAGRASAGAEKAVMAVMLPVRRRRGASVLVTTGLVL
jgi:hypothetical protein